MPTLEEHKEALKTRIISMEIKKKMCQIGGRLTSQVQYTRIIEQDIKTAKIDLQKACESYFKDDPNIIRQINKLGPRINEVERLYDQKRPS